MIDLDKLEALAKRADMAAWEGKSNDYIAAMSPDVCLAMIEEIRAYSRALRRVGSMCPAFDGIRPDNASR